MVVFCQLFGDIPGHGDVKVSFVVLPVQRDTAVHVAFVVYLDIIMAFYCCYEMFQVFFSNVFYSKVVYDKGELYGAADVFE